MGRFRGNPWFNGLIFFAALFLLPVIWRLVSGHPVTSGYVVSQAVSSAIATVIYVGLTTWLVRRRVTKAQADAAARQRDA
ncbi:MAG: hypothetical protein ACOYB7_01900 [Mycobacterium sp.]